MLKAIARRFVTAIRRTRTVIYLGLHVVLVLGGSLVATLPGRWSVAVGTSVIATGISGMVVFGWVLFSEEQVEKGKIIEAFGFVTAFPNRSIQIKHEYEERLQRAKKSIDIMGFGLNALREDFVGQFGEWASRATVRVLLVHPDAPDRHFTYTGQRDQEERNQPDKTATEVRRFIADTKHLWSDPAINFSLRLAKTLPSVNMFRIDNECFWGPYLISSANYGRASRNLPTLIVENSGYMFERLADHFEVIWTNDAFSERPNVAGPASIGGGHQP